MDKIDNLLSTLIDSISKKDFLKGNLEEEEIISNEILDIFIKEKVDVINDKNTSKEQRKAALNKLISAFGDKGIDTLVNIIKDQNIDSEIRNEAIETFISRCMQPISGLISIYKDETTNKYLKKNIFNALAIIYFPIVESIEKYGEKYGEETFND